MVAKSEHRLRSGARELVVAVGLGAVIFGLGAFAAGIAHSAAAIPLTFSSAAAVSLDSTRGLPSPPDIDARVVACLRRCVDAPSRAPRRGSEFSGGAMTDPDLDMTAALWIVATGPGLQPQAQSPAERRNYLLAAAALAHRRSPPTLAGKDLR